MTSLTVWKKVVAQRVASVLRPAGFRGSGANYSARRRGVVWLVNLQSSNASERTRLKITANVGIVVEALAHGTRPSVWEAHWSRRIGDFLDEPKDHWWIVHSEEEADQAAREMADLIEARVLPELHRFEWPEALSALWSTGVGPGLTDPQRREYLRRLQELTGQVET